MGYRYDMAGKTGQQQAIVRARDEADKLRKQIAVSKEVEVKCSPSPRTADFEGVFFTKNDIPLFELRVSGTAIVNGPSKLKEINIHEWLCKTGRSFLNQVKDFEIIMITSHDVLNQELTTDWKNLRREHKESEKE